MMLFTLTKNELIKIFKRDKTWVVIGIFVILIFSLAYLNKKESDQAEFYSSAKGQVSNLNQQVVSLENELEQAKLASDANANEKVAEAEANLKHFEGLLEKEKYIAENEDKPGFWRTKLEMDKESIEENIAEDSIPEEYKTNQRERIKEIDMYLEKDIQPIEEWNFNAIGFAKTFINTIGFIILVVAIAILMSDIVSGELTPPTIKFLLVQPIGRGKVVLSKFIAATIAIVGIFETLQLATFAVIGVFYGFGGAQIPVMIGKKYFWDSSNLLLTGTSQLKAVADSGFLSTRGDALIESFAMQVLFIITCCAFVFLISVLFNNSMITMAISVIIPVATTILLQCSDTMGLLTHYVFISYSNSPSIIDGSIALEYKNLNFSVTLGIIVMGVTTLICYGVAHIIFKKKDMLI